MGEFLLRNARKFIVGVIGGTIVLIGMVTIFLPGPGLLIILGGMALLATEFVWAAVLLRKVKAMAKATKQKIVEIAETAEHAAGIGKAAHGNDAAKKDAGGSEPAKKTDAPVP